MGSRWDRDGLKVGLRLDRDWIETGIWPRLFGLGLGPGFGFSLGLSLRFVGVWHRLVGVRPRFAGIRHRGFVGIQTRFPVQYQSFELGVFSFQFCIKLLEFSVLPLRFGLN